MSIGDERDVTVTMSTGTGSVGTRPAEPEAAPAAAEWDTPERAAVGTGSVTGPERGEMERRPARSMARSGLLAACALLLAWFRREKQRRADRRLVAATHAICRGGGGCLRSVEDERARCPWAGRGDFATSLAVHRATMERRFF